MNCVDETTLDGLSDKVFFVIFSVLIWFSVAGVCNCVAFSFSATASSLLSLSFFGFSLFSHRSCVSEVSFNSKLEIFMFSVDS